MSETNPPETVQHIAIVATREANLPRADPWLTTDVTLPFVTEITRRPSLETNFSYKEMERVASKMPALIADTAMTYALVGHTCGSPWSKLEQQLNVCRGEWEELCTAIEDRDAIMLRDAIGDLFYTVVGMAWRAGIPFADDLEQVVQSNLTKFDINPEDADRTRNKYLLLGVNTRCEKTMFRSDGTAVSRNYYVTFVDGDQVGKDGKEYPNGKWLKSVLFKDICLTPLNPQHPLELTSHQRLASALERASNQLINTRNGQSALTAAFVSVVYLEQLMGRVDLEPLTAVQIGQGTLASVFAVHHGLTQRATDWAYSTAQWITTQDVEEEVDDSATYQRKMLKNFLRAAVEHSLPNFFKGIRDVRTVAADNVQSSDQLFGLVAAAVRQVIPALPVNDETHLTTVLYDFLFGE